MEATAVPRRITEEETACRICSKPVDLTKLCAIYPDGSIAHYAPCYDGHWLEAGIAAGVTIVGDVADRSTLVALGAGLEQVGGEA